MNFKAQEKSKNKHNHIKLKKVLHSKGNNQLSEETINGMEKNFQITNVIRGKYLKYMRNSKNSVTKQNKI
jgi:hypothetical protein